MQRGHLLLGLLAATVLLALELAQLLGSAYAGAAQRRLDAPTDLGAVHAASIAASLAPWSSHYPALLGWIHAARGDADASADAYARALRRAPADALLWTEYAQALGRLGRFDAELHHALERAQALAPASPAVQHALAEQALSYWSRGTPAIRERWLEAMRDELEHRRGAFLPFVLIRGRARTFCDEMAEAVNETAWCRSKLARPPGGCYDVTRKGLALCKTGS